MERTNLKNNFEAVQRYINNAEWGDCSSAATQLRIMGEYIAEFYVNQLKLTQEAEKKRQKGINIAYTAQFLTLRDASSDKFEKNFKQDLILFLELSRKFGNRSSHDSDEIAKYKVEFVAFFYKEYIKAQFEKDYFSYWFKDVTRDFSKRNISIFSLVSGRFASAYDNVEGKPVLCNVEKQSTWESFYVKVDASGWATLRPNTESRLYLKADIAQEDAPVMANSSNTQEWERFKIYQNQGDNIYYIKAKGNHKWLTCRIDKEPDFPLQAGCAREEPEEWERFEIKIL